MYEKKSTQWPYEADLGLSCPPGFFLVHFFLVFEGPGRTAREIKKIFATGAKKPCCATGFESKKKSSTVPGRSCHLCKEKRVLQINFSNADSGAQLKVRVLPSGLNK